MIGFHCVLGLFLALLLTGCGGGNGDVVNNGGGLPEREFAFALERLHIFIDVTQRTASLSGPETRLLAKIERALPQEREVPALLRWTSRKATSHEGIARAAWTDDFVGAPIFLQRDAFPPMAPDLFPRAVATLIHELGHHHEVRAHEWLDQLGAKVARAAQLHFHEVSSRTIYPEGPETVAFVLNDPAHAPAAWLAFSGHQIGFDDHLAALVVKHCRPPVRGPGFRLGSPQWALSTPNGRLDYLDVGSRLELTVPVVLVCNVATEGLHFRAPRLRMMLEASDLREIVLALPAKLSSLPGAFFLWLSRSFFTDIVDRHGRSLLQ